MSSRNLEQIVTNVEQCIATLARPSDGLIPSVRKLAGWWGVSKDTAHRVIKCLVRKGILERVPHSGRYRMRNMGAKVTSSTGSPHAARSSELAEIMQKEILSNRAPFRHGECLSISALSSKYGASRGTIGSALRELSERWGLVVRVGRRYRVLPAYRKARETSVYFLARQQFARDPLLLRSIYAAEEHLSTIGWGRLNLVTSEASIPEPHRVAGLIVESQKFETTPSLHNVPFPITILNRSDEPFTHPLGRYREIRFDNRHAGRSVAEFLLNLGHRDIILFTHLPMGTPWVRKRVDGIREIYPLQSPGHDRSMLLYDCSECFSAGHNVPGIRTSLRDLLYTKLQETAISPPGEIPPAIFQSIYASVDIAVGVTHQLSCLRPLFRRALENRHYTAWVCINDAVAYCAAEYLRHESTDTVHLQVIGFDNADLAITQNITSFDSGYSEMGRLAVASLADPELVTQSYGETAMVRGSIALRSGLPFNAR